MTKEEFFDKIDKIHGMVDNDFHTGAGVEEILSLLDELKEDTNLLLEDEYDAGYDLGLDRGRDE